MADPRCAVAILPARDGDADQASRSVEAAAELSSGDFIEIRMLDVDASLARRDVVAAAARAASAERFDWLLLLSAAEALVPQALEVVAPALRIHDAVWGGAGLVRPDGTTTELERITRLAAQDLPGYFHAALAWWIGPAHFVRPEVAAQALREPVTEGWYADYMLALWRNTSAYKTAQPLTRFHGALPELADADRARLIRALADEPVFMPVRHGATTAELPYTGLNPVIEREQMRGLFFEDEELRFLADRLPRGLQIIDAGANTGNHTVFFATAMEAESVFPVEPHPRAAAAIRDAVEANRLGNVDLSGLGFALGASPGRLKLVPSETAGLGATRFVEAASGTVPVVPLDALICDPVDLLKVDVEGMEADVLLGAMGTIARFRPAIFIEVADCNVAEFLAWVDANGYQIEKLFPDKAHCNYLVVPRDRS